MTQGSEILKDSPIATVLMGDIASVGVMNTNRQPGRDAKVPSGIDLPGCGAGTRQTRSTKVSTEFLERPRRCYRPGRFSFCGSAMSLLLFCPGIGSLKTNYYKSYVRHTSATHHPSHPEPEPPPLEQQRHLVVLRHPEKCQGTKNPPSLLPRNERARSCSAQARPHSQRHDQKIRQHRRLTVAEVSRLPAFKNFNPNKSKQHTSHENQRQHALPLDFPAFSPFHSLL